MPENPFEEIEQSLRFIIARYSIAYGTKLEFESYGIKGWGVKVPEPSSTIHRKESDKKTLRHLITSCGLKIGFGINEADIAILLPTENTKDIAIKTKQIKKEFTTKTAAPLAKARVTSPDLNVALAKQQMLLATVEYFRLQFPKISQEDLMNKVIPVWRVMVNINNSHADNTDPELKITSDDIISALKTYNCNYDLTRGFLSRVRLKIVEDFLNEIDSNKPKEKWR